MNRPNCKSLEDPDMKEKDTEIMKVTVVRRRQVKGLISDESLESCRTRFRNRFRDHSEELNISSDLVPDEQNTMIFNAQSCLQELLSYCELMSLL